MRKVQLDQFFTLQEDAIRFIEKVDNVCDLSKYDLVLEPSAGSGSFYHNIPYPKIGLDLEPMSDDIIKMDFFDYAPPASKKIAVIGNPPFGRKGSLAKKFFAKCSEFADVIAFILPAIFAKPSFNSSLNQHFHCVYEEHLKRFETPDGTEYNVNCVFQIWVRMNTRREPYIKLDTNEDFEMIHRHISRTPKEELARLRQNYDFAYGQISHKLANISNLQKGSQFLVKDRSSHGRVKDIFEQMDFDHLHKYSMGATSLSRDDIFRQYEKQKAVLLGHSEQKDITHFVDMQPESV